MNINVTLDRWFLSTSDGLHFRVIGYTANGGPAYVTTTVQEVLPDCVVRTYNSVYKLNPNGAEIPPKASQTLKSLYERILNS